MAYEIPTFAYFDGDEDETVSFQDLDKLVKADKATNCTANCDNTDCYQCIFGDGESCSFGTYVYNELSQPNAILDRIESELLDTKLKKLGL